MYVHAWAQVSGRLLKLKGVVRKLHIMCARYSYTNFPVICRGFTTCCMSSWESSKLPVSKTQSSYSVSFFQYIIFCIVFHLYIPFLSFRESIKHSCRWRQRTGSVYILWSRSYINSNSFGSMSSGVMTLPMKRMEPGERRDTTEGHMFCFACLV